MSAVLNMIDFSKVPVVSALLNEMENFTSSDYNPSFVEPLTGSIAYWAICYGLKKYTAQRSDKIDVKNVAIVHNIILIVLSVVMMVGGIHALWQRYVGEGFMGCFCAGSMRRAGTVLDGPAGFWMKVYYLSKYYELGDTFLLCLKGHKTIPLHLYHHVIMLWGTWSWGRYEAFEGMLWCVIVNSIIHTFMYTYYLLAVFGKRVWWKKYLTGAQIVQFLTGMIYVTIYLYLAHTRDDGCGEKERLYAAWVAHIVNCTFVFLFTQFYISSYSVKAKNGIATKTD